MLIVEGISTYYGQIRALKDVSIRVEDKSLVSIVGSNGAGKTTLLSSIYGLIQYQQGKVIFDGIDITNANTKQLVKLGISLVPERREIFSELSVQDNLLLGAYKHVIRRQKEIVKRNFDFVYNLFPRLKERVRQKAGTLSGGEQQMLAIGRALMSSPESLFLDEPSLGLAPLVVAEIFKTISSLNQGGVSILLVEQNAMQALKIAHYGYILQIGEIAKEGISSELLDNQQIKEMYLGDSI